MKQILAATAVLLTALVQPSSAQSVPAYQRFAGQVNEHGQVCNPAGSERDRRICLWMYVSDEERALDEVVTALLEKANVAPPASTVAESGFGGRLAPERTQGEALVAAQASWLAWRNDECVLGTIEAQGGSMRRLTYPSCVARLTALRRERLSALLALWNVDFDGPHGRPASAACALEPAACPQRH
jgi:uncharacterized protein YecT (DUF1311 family)